MLAEAWFVEVALPAHGALDLLHGGQRGDLRGPVERRAVHGAPILHHTTNPYGGDRIEFNGGCPPFIIRS